MPQAATGTEPLAWDKGKEECGRRGESGRSGVQGVETGGCRGGVAGHAEAVGGSRQVAAMAPAPAPTPGLGQNCSICLCTPPTLNCKMRSLFSHVK